MSKDRLVSFGIYKIIRGEARESKDRYDPNVLPCLTELLAA
jgi:hypothetical protein